MRLIVGVAVTMSVVSFVLDDEYVNISVLNRATRPIERISVDDGRNVHELASVSPGQRSFVRFPVAAKASYRVRVVFTDGKILENCGRHLEAGRRCLLSVYDGGFEDAVKTCSLWENLLFR